MDSFDLAIIGAGPGGYVAAIRAADLGLKVLLIERGKLGGTCLNVGCIPTKRMAGAAELLEKIKKAKSFGLIVDGTPHAEGAALFESREKLLEKMRSNLTSLIDAHKITRLQGEASFSSPNTLKINSEEISFKTAIIATGSKPTSLPFLPVDGKHVVDSTSLLAKKEIPKSLVVIGGGYIGCEFASIYALLGSKVILVEALDSLVAMQGKTLSEALKERFIQMGIELHLGQKIEKLSNENGGARLFLAGGKELFAECALVAVGRLPVTDGLNLGAAGVAVNERGFVQVNASMQTSQPHIFAVGDCNGLSMLAHAASTEGLFAARMARYIIDGLPVTEKLDLSSVPGVVFTSPEMGFVGMTLEEAQKKDPSMRSTRFAMGNLGKAQADLAEGGLFELVFRPSDGRIFGAFVIGKDASSLLGEAAIAVQRGLSLHDIEETIHPHPTLSEGFHEAASLGLDLPIHTLKSKTR